MLPQELPPDKLDSDQKRRHFPVTGDKSIQRWKKYIRTVRFYPLAVNLSVCEFHRSDSKCTSPVEHKRKSQHKYFLLGIKSEQQIRSSWSKSGSERICHLNACPDFCRHPRHRINKQRKRVRRQPHTFAHPKFRQLWRK